MELHGGSITATSADRDAGAQFMVELPVPRANAEVDERTATARSQLAR